VFSSPHFSPCTYTTLFRSRCWWPTTEISAEGHRSRYACRGTRTETAGTAFAAAHARSHKHRPATHIAAVTCQADGGYSPLKSFAQDQSKGHVSILGAA